MNIYRRMITILAGVSFICAPLVGIAEIRAFTIEEAVSEVFAKNPQVQQADNLVKSAKESLIKARTAFLPKASMSYSYTGLIDAPVMKQGGVDVPVGHDNQYHWDVSLAQPIFTGFALSSQLKLAKLDLNTRTVEKEQRFIELARDIKSACYNLLLANKMFNVAKEEVEALTSHRDEARQFYEQGLIPQNDLLKSEVALSSAIQRKETADAATKNAMALVNMLMNADLNRPVSIVDIDAALIQKKYDYLSLSKAAKKNRPELIALKQSLEKADIGKTLARSGYYPEIAMIGQYERNGDTPSMSENDYSNETNTSLTLQAKWTFFEWGKTKAEVYKANHEKRALKDAIKNVENVVCLEVNSALLNLNVSGKNIRTAKNSLEQAKENWRITKAQYAEQIATSADVLDARTFLTGADSNYYGALYGYMISLADLDRSVGQR